MTKILVNKEFVSRAGTLIKYEVLEDYIRQVESVIDTLSMPEKELIIKNVQERQQQIISRMKAETMIGNIDMTNMIRRFGGSDGTV